MTPMGGGIHFKSGPAGIHYRTADTKNGSYEVHASFNQVEPADHPEAYGLFVGGIESGGCRPEVHRTSWFARTGSS